MMDNIGKRTDIACLLIAFAGFFAATLFGAVMLGYVVDQDTLSLQNALTSQVSTVFVVAICAMAISYAFLKIQWSKRLARQLREVRRRVETLQDEERVVGQHAALCILDENGRFLSANDRLEDLFDLSESTLLDKTLSEVEIFARSEISEIIASAVAANQTTTTEISLDNGAQRAIVRATIMPQFDIRGKHYRTILVFTDLTFEKAAEMNRFLSATLEGFQDEVYVYEVDTLKVRYMNAAACRRCGWTLREAQGKMIWDTVRDFDVGLFRNHTRELVTRKAESATVEFRHPKGPVEIVTRIMDDIGGKQLFVSSLRDVTHRREIENAKFQSVSMISHEMRSPLASIKGSLALIKSGAVGEVPKQVGDIVDIAIRNSDRLLIIVNDILDLEKIRSEQMDFSMGAVDLVGLVEDAIEINTPYAERFGVRFEADLPASALVTANYDRLMQVATNLMSNAAKFSPSGGFVRLGLEERGEEWVVCVSDEGPGIPREVQDRIGEPFAQFSAADGRKREGTGLGLSIVKQILVRHNSRLEFESEPGQGTTFCFAMPKLDRAETEAA